MKTLIYDNECPLCTAYTGAFVKTGLLPKEGRKNFNEASPQMLQQLDTQKSHDEIPLIDRTTGQVWYGIDALLEILGSKMPLVKKAGHWKPLNWLLKKIYKLISYNRKVIVAIEPAGYNCSPTFNSRYRILFLLIGLAINSWLFTAAIPLLIKTAFTATTAMQLQWAHYSLVAINIGIALLLGRQKGLNYLGQVNMLAITGILLLLPLMALQPIISINLQLILLGAVAAFLTHEYVRRMRYAGIVNNYKIVVAVNAACIVGCIVYLN